MSGKPQKLRGPSRSVLERVTPLALRKALGELAAYSMISLRGDRFSMHRLVQTVEIDHLNQQMFRRWGKRALEVVNLAFPEPNRPYTIHGDYYRGDPYFLCHHLLPSAKHCLNVTQQAGIAIRVRGRLTKKVELYEAAVFYKAEWDRSGGLWE